MDSFGWAMLLKPIIGLGLLLAVFGSARLLAWVIWRILPDGKLKRELFRKEGDGVSPANLPQSRKNLFD